MRIASGVTDQYIYFVAVDATDLKTRETGLSSFTVYRSRNGGVAAVYTTPTINETDSTNMPGVYELLLDEDMTIDSGDETQEICLHITHAGMTPVTRVFELYRPKITAGNTLGVASDGDISGNLDGTVATVTTLTSHTPQTGDTYALANGVTGFVAIDTVVDSILVDTDTTIPALIATAQTDLDAITGTGGVLIGTDVMDRSTTLDVNAKTITAGAKTGFALSSTGADLILSSSTFAAAIADAIWDELMAGHVTVDTAGLVMNELQDAGRLDALIDAIKTVTDQFVFTVANQVDANTLSVGGTTQTANDMSGDCNTILTNIATAQADLDIITGADGAIIVSTQDLTATMKTSVNTEVDNALDTAIPGSPTVESINDVLNRQRLATVKSTCAAGSTTTVVETNLTEATDDHYNGGVIVFKTGALTGQRSSISDYNGTTKQLTVVALTEAPANTDAFEIV